MLSAITNTFLVPDNHIGRAVVSSIAVAHEVVEMGGTAIACLNARERNTLGFRRDLLTAAAYRPLPEWKQDADFLLAQVSFSMDDLITWRRSTNFSGPVYAGVMVPPSAARARKLASEVRDCGLFDGVHLIAVRSYREVASRLEAFL